jgi:hypothetical protein
MDKLSDTITLQERSAAIHWTDFVLSRICARTLRALYLLALAWRALQSLSFPGVSVLFFRAGTFFHEILHFAATRCCGSVVQAIAASAANLWRAARAARAEDSAVDRWRGYARSWPLSGLRR